MLRGDTYPAMRAVEVRDLSFTYRKGTQPALRQINLNVEESSCVVLMGKTGAGKSTLCCALNGLVPRFQRGDFEGRLSLFGRDPANSPVHEITSEVGLVLQDFEGQLFSTSVELEVAFFPENLGVPREEIVRRVRESIGIVGLAGFERRQPFSLSGGEKQRLAIASVLSGSPRLLVLDEPTTDLDPAGKSEVLSLARRLRQARRTMVLVEHESEELTEVDRIVVLRKGQILAEGPPERILTDAGLLESQGIRPPSIPDFFSRLGTGSVPMVIEEGLREFRRRGLVLDTERTSTLIRSEADRAKGEGQPVVRARALSHTYAGGARVLRGVDLDIRRGEFLAVVGQNGSGKTTLVKHINGLLLPSSGTVEVLGRRVQDYRKSELGRIVGYVFQNPDHQIFAETVREEVSFGPRNLGVPPGEIEQRVAEALAAVDLQGYEARDPFALTKGERQRVAVASVLATRPQILILDEPTTGLDYGETRSMMALVQRLNCQGYTTIIVTHSMWVVAEYARRAVVMGEGRIMFDGAPRSLFRDDELLGRCHLKRPSICELGLRLGGAALSVAELLAWVKRV
jgi:energy-coupling factor transport system ATP-binding protein